MMPAAFAAFFLALMAYYADITLPALQTTARTVTADVVANNFLSYRYSVVQYALAHPATTGTVADASLSFQSGYVRNAAWSNTITGGQLYVYATSSSAVTNQSATMIFQRSGNSPLMGFSSGSNFNSMSLGLTSLTLPGGIPSGAFVAIGK